jgi:hypothetical protein
MEIEESDNLSFPFKVNTNIDILLPKEKRISFQKSYAYLRKTLEIKLKRKTNIDSLLKKCKSRFFKAIHDCLKKCIKNSESLRKLPQNFITNISIEYNRSIFDKSLNEFYNYFNNIPNNANNIDNFIEGISCLKEKEHLCRYLCTRKLSELYILYIQSKRYKNEVIDIKKKFGYKMMILYQFVSENFINYYYYTKPHVNKKSHKIIFENSINAENSKLFCIKKKQQI